MFHQPVLNFIFALVLPFANLTIQLWISILLMQLLILKDGLDIILWACLKLNKLVLWILEVLCTKYSLALVSFVNEIQKNFPQPVLTMHSYRNLQSDKESGIRILKYERAESTPQSKYYGRYVCQKCQTINEASMSCKSGRCEILKHSVGTQTIIEREILNNEHSLSKTPTHSSIISIFEKEELNSAESLRNNLISSNCKKPIAKKCKISPVRYPSSICEYKNAVECRSPEFEKHKSSPENRNDSRNFVPEAFVDIPLESPENFSQLLESPLCQINLESMKNLRLQFSKDVCIPSMSPERKSVFGNGWNKFKLIRKANKRFLEMKNVRRDDSEGSGAYSQPAASAESANTPYRCTTRNFNSENSPHAIGCCRDIFRRLKSTFDQKIADGSVAYRKF